ncbi:hypothetical protein [Brevundimonas sp. M20]|uniref:hypothetical protein n=1 Tax=Brevundimonas sp. M20 TaxID=2591463 RepID=UPI00143D9A99
MIAMSVASILMVGAGAAYAALGRSAHRLALAQAGLADRAVPTCRAEDPASSPPERPYRCTLPERCEFDSVSQSCRPNRT